MNDPLDLLQIKIDQAKAKLPDVTRQAIDAVDWKPGLMEFRTKKGYTFEQLEHLQIETELVLAGLVSPEDYPKQLETQMKLTKDQVGELVKEMNSLVFSRIRAELIKNSERNKVVKVKIESAPIKPEPKVVKVPVVSKPDLSLPELEMPEGEHAVLNNAGIKIVPSDVPLPPKEEKEPEEMPVVPPTASKSIPIISKTAIPDIKKPNEEVGNLLAKKLSTSFQMPKVETHHSIEPAAAPVKGLPKVDPYREMPE